MTDAPRTLNDLGVEDAQPDTGATAPRRALHPTMQTRARLVKEAHAHLAAAHPGFRSLPPRQKMMAVQQRVTRQLSRLPVPSKRKP